MKKAGLIILMLAGIILNTYAQKTICGKVIDSSTGEALPGVSIVIKGTTIGAITDLDGKYCITVTDESSAMIFSTVGFLTEEVVIGDKNTIDVALMEDLMELDEVVVIGYAPVVKRYCTGSVASVKTESITHVIPSLLKGTVAGASKHIEKLARKMDKALVREYRTKANLLTAGEINDFSKWDLWKDISKSDLKSYQTKWEFNPQRRYSVQLLDANEHPVIDAEVCLLDSGNNILWSAKTENTGKAELWDNRIKGKADENVMVKVKCNNRISYFKNPMQFEEGVNMYVLDENIDIPLNVDVAFVVDATSSMLDEISYLRAELYDIMNTVKNSLNDKQLNMATVFYRDHADAYVTKHTPLSGNINNSTNFIKLNHAGGGGDYPEAVDMGLTVAIDSLNWSENALCRVAFLILDAPPHNDPEVKKSLDRIIKDAARIGVRIVPVTCSGIDKSTEYLMRCFALLTNGTYVFLTDDSGIGYSHIKPSTDDYEVELLNELLLRLLYQYTYLPENAAWQKEREWDEDIIFLKTDNEQKSIVRGDEVKVYPNPCKDYVNISGKEEISELHLNDITGKILFRYTDAGKEASIDLSRYPNGTYFIRWKSDKDAWKQKRIIRLN